jgi:hypothetical protein
MYVANAGQYQLAIAVRIPDSAAESTCFTEPPMLQLDEDVLVLNTRKHRNPSQFIRQGN